MAVLRGGRRRALWAVYAFCRAVDDIADGAAPEAEKRRFLADWRGKLARPDCALSRELAWARDAHGVPLAECEAMVAGMETDAADRLRLPDEAALHEIYRIMQSPGIDELFHADEDRFIDRTATMTIHCEVRDTGVQFDPRGTVFDTSDGQPRWDD